MAQESAAHAGHQAHETGAEALAATQAHQAGADFQWHYGRVTRLGSFEVAGGKQVTSIWEEGGISSQQGNMSAEQWEIFELALMTSGRIAVLSDKAEGGWMYDNRFLEAVR